VLFSFTSPSIFGALLPSSEVVIFALVDWSNSSKVGGGLSVVAVTGDAEEVLDVVFEGRVAEEDDTSRVCKLETRVIVGGF
jgi:hypothetical protein